jgi:hypothetical protein
MAALDKALFKEDIRNMQMGTGMALGFLMIALRVCADEILPVLKVGDNVFSNVTVIAVTPTDICFTYPGGMANAKLKELDPELQKHFHYNATNAMAVEKKQIEANAQYHADLASHPAQSPPKENRLEPPPAAAAPPPVGTDELERLAGDVHPNPSHMKMHEELSSASFANHPLFPKGGPSKDDIFQGSVSDCYFMSHLGALADAHPGFISNTVAALSDSTYVVRFFIVFRINNGYISRTVVWLGA